MRRVYTPFSVHRGFQEHFNHSVGRFVNTERELKSELSRASEEYTARTGVPANFQPVHPEEIKHTVNGEGLESTHRKEVELGKREVKQWR